MKKIGSLREHMIRTGQIAILLAEKLVYQLMESIDLARAAAIYKFDLLTRLWLVRFDELQDHG